MYNCLNVNWEINYKSFFALFLMLALVYLMHQIYFLGSKYF